MDSTEYPANKFYGQNLQDRYCYNHFLKEKKGGTFLDIGASDGKTFSNTLFFEKEMGYTGLCIEPRKVAFNKLVALRKCHCENVAIDTKEAEDVLFLELKGYGSGLSGLVNRYDPRHIKRISWEKNNSQHQGSEVIKVKTVRLETLLDKYDLHHIDVCSLDVEGAELKILQSVDWDKTHIGVLIVENNYHDPQMRKYLESVGFKFECVLHYQDEVYTHLD